MGLSNLKYVNKIIKSRKKSSELYNKLLKNTIKTPIIPNDCQYNYAYYPIIFNKEKDLLKTVENLNKKEIYPRRYFYPSLNTLPYLNIYQKCNVSEDISKRILCLPLYLGLKKEIIINICKIINNIFN
jgi:dTDP-4-amino-4,6-dideoxygalactose transaminase